MTELQERLDDITAWPHEHKLRLFAELQKRLWHAQARPEQLPPEGEWRAWYLMAGRGAGKTRAGAETLAQWEGENPPGEWGIIAPTMSDAVNTCVEQALLPILGARVKKYNRSLFEIALWSGSRIFLDGADDGALRMQGRNLRGAWCDEIGLWKSWDLAWNESLAFAVRHDPGRIVVSGTPKMGHPLVKQLVDDPLVPVSRMRTSDNVQNLSEEAIAYLYAQFGGGRRGKQELEGEWVAALEGDLLKRSWWRYYEPKGRTEKWETYLKRLPRFQWVVVSVDTPLKDKESSDFVAIQVWGVDRANRYLLDARTERMGYEQARRAIMEMSRWARKTWNCRHKVLIENAGYGVELVIDLQRELGLIQKISPGSEGSKGMRALAASSDLESGNVYLPGRIKDDRSGPAETSPNITLSLVDEAAMFQVDGSHGSHDDQVDSWSQCMNWLRTKSTSPARTWSSFKRTRAA